MQKRNLGVALGLLGATMLSTPAGAQTTAGPNEPAVKRAVADSDQAQLIETVVVTARRRAENLERVPVAVTAISPAVRSRNPRGSRAFGRDVFC